MAPKVGLDAIVGEVWRRNQLRRLSKLPLLDVREEVERALEREQRRELLREAPEEKAPPEFC